MRRFPRSSVLALGLLVACAGSKKGVEVEGGDPELARLAGVWLGDYQGNESGRSGPIRFELELGRHTAIGEVLMGGNTPVHIEFVKVDQGKLRGTIAPYTDPTCSCEVETSFLGTMGSEAIAGTFETKVSASGQIQTGTWQVERQR